MSPRPPPDPPVPSCPLGALPPSPTTSSAHRPLCPPPPSSLRALRGGSTPTSPGAGPRRPLEGPCPLPPSSSAPAPPQRASPVTGVGSNAFRTQKALSWDPTWNSALAGLPPSQSDGAVFPPSATPSPLPLCPSLPSPSPKAEVVRGTHVVRGTRGISLPGSLLRASPSTQPLPPPPGALHPGPTPFTPQVWLALLPTQVLGPESPQPSPISRLVSPTTPFPPRRQLLQTHRTGLVTLSSRAFGGFLRSQQEDPRTDLPSAPLPCSLSSRRTGHQRGPSSLPSALL